MRREVCLVLFSVFVESLLLECVRQPLWSMCTCSILLRGSEWYYKQEVCPIS